MDEKCKKDSEDSVVSTGVPVSNGTNDVNIMDTKVSWFVCGCCSLSNMIILGCLYTYSILFPKILEEFQESKAETAMVASIGLSVYTFMCPLCEKLSLRFGCRTTMAASGIMSALGLLVSSFALSLNVLYLTFGVLVGLASSLVYMSAFKTVPLYFEKHRDFATGITSMGPGTGALVMSPVLTILLEHFNWRTTLQLMAVINLLPSFLGCSITRKTNPVVKNEEDTPAEAGSNTNGGGCCRIVQVLDFSVFKDPIFGILSGSASFYILACMIPYVHLVKHALEVGVPIHLSSWFICSFGIASSVSRLLSGKLCNTGWISYISFYQFGAIAIALTNLLAPMATTFTSLMVYCVLYGICDGMSSVSMNCYMMKYYGSSGLGWFFSLQGFSLFVSPVLAGGISDITGSYNPVFYTAAGIQLMVLCLSQMARCFIRKKFSTSRITPVGQILNTDFISQNP